MLINSRANKVPLSADRENTRFHETEVKGSLWTAEELKEPVTPRRAPTISSVGNSEETKVGLF